MMFETVKIKRLGLIVCCSLVVLYAEQGRGEEAKCGQQRQSSMKSEEKQVTNWAKEYFQEFQDESIVWNTAGTLFVVYGRENGGEWEHTYSYWCFRVVQSGEVALIGKFSTVSNYAYPGEVRINEQGVDVKFFEKGNIKPVMAQFFSFDDPGVQLQIIRTNKPDPDGLRELQGLLRAQEPKKVGGGGLIVEQSSASANTEKERSVDQSHRDGDK